MSLDMTSHPVRSGPDELVPSRYALKVGEIDVMVVSDGVLSLPTAMLAHNIDPAVRAAWLNDMFLPPDVFEWALNVVVVRSGGRTILIDAGLGSDPDLDLPRAGQLIKRLEAAGIDLASVTDVVLTHMHMDHIGGLLVDGVKDRLRPDLRIHVAAAEVKFWESPDFSHVSMPPGFPDALRSDCQAVLERVPEPAADVRGGVRSGAGGGRHSHRRPHPRAQRGPPGIRQRPADVRWRRSCSRSGSNTPSGTTASNTIPRRRPASGSVFCGSWRRPAGCWWPLTCRSRPSAMWRSPATPFVGYRPSGSTDRLLGQGRTGARTHSVNEFTP